MKRPQAHEHRHSYPVVFEDWEHAGNDGYKTLLAKDDTAFAVKSSMADPKAYVLEYRQGLLQRGYTRDETIPIKAIGVWDTVGSLGVPVNPLLQRIGFPTVLREYRLYNTDLGTNVENAFQALALDEARAAYRPALWQKLPGSTSNLKVRTEGWKTQSARDMRAPDPPTQHQLLRPCHVDLEYS